MEHQEAKVYNLNLFVIHTLKLSFWTRRLHTFIFRGDSGPNGK